MAAIDSSRIWEKALCVVSTIVVVPEDLQLIRLVLVFEGIGSRINQFVTKIG